MSDLTIETGHTINWTDRAFIEEIAKTDDHPVLMINQNLYTEETDFPNGELYKKWRAINKKLIEHVDGRIIWAMPGKGQVGYKGECQALSEILAYWYPSHQAFLSLMDAPYREENFSIRKEIIKYAIVHRCDGRNPPMLSST